MNRQKLVLCLLLLVFAGSVVYSFLRSPKQQQVAELKQRPGAAAPAVGSKGGAAPKGAGDEARVHLELLDQGEPQFTGFRRNIFSPIFSEELKVPPFKPLPPPPRPVQAPAPAPAPLPAPPPPPPSPEQVAAQLADSELSKFTFLGFLKKNGEKTVFLSSNNEIFLAKKGSKLGQKFQVADLTDDAITIRSVAGGREIVIPLVENRALSTRRTSKSTP
ncbi:MAG: type II secretion system protein PulP [Geobacteraceae bacterium GWC2_58_44]|nr:MAG: type II secretion system protein PulP [Geobacteraceae bacterium GWC2_58_44]HBG08058.1 type II secretion system protein PulP [Geobacter sp.]